MQFDDVADMHSFVNDWILKFGQPRQHEIKIGWQTSIQNEAYDFCSFLLQSFCPARCRGGYRQQTRLSNEDSSANSAPADEDFKLFEIHRIRNRFDPKLIAVSGGYRDLAFKLKIGFVR